MVRKRGFLRENRNLLSQVRCHWKRFLSCFALKRWRFLGMDCERAQLLIVCLRFLMGRILMWRSVVRLAMRFNHKKRIKAVAECSSIVQDIFEGLRKCDDLDNGQVKLTASLDDKDVE